ncbi:ABC transporter permease [Ornithinibacillus massiliensis]|uniref:Transport permease protein n=1 Tax=Ornithinibacillus massiliensis TaxID=1944633 RepID=A0ABS5MHM2_9BACI|nr:ABC transporter permease [Ornithinibacillus massiliensis]MBS3681839.1 ABC transporter permease [Ornithinibacillus massiliensis]
MFNIIGISLSKDIKDYYLLFWSIFLPIGIFTTLSLLAINVNGNLLFGILTLSIFFYCCTTNSFAIFAQRKRGVYELLTITPFSLWKYLSSITISQTIIACTVSNILLIIENGIFDLTLSVLQILLFLPFFFVGSALFTLIGFCLSSFPKNEGQLSITTNLVMIPLFLCSSVFFNLDNSPKWVQWISWINPVEWLQSGYRSILENHVSIYFLSIAILFAFLLLFLFLSKMTFRVQ